MSSNFKLFYVATLHFLTLNILCLSCHNTALIVWLGLGRKITWLGSGKDFLSFFCLFWKPQTQLKTVPRFPYKISSGVELTKWWNVVAPDRHLPSRQNIMLALTFPQTADTSKVDVWSKHGMSHSHLRLISWCLNQKGEWKAVALLQPTRLQNSQRQFESHPGTLPCVWDGSKMGVVATNPPLSQEVRPFFITISILNN